jgi:hypothetical protein
MLGVLGGLLHVISHVTFPLVLIKEEVIWVQTITRRKNGAKGRLGKFFVAVLLY